MNKIQEKTKENEKEMFDFLQRILRIESYTGKETAIIDCIKNEMLKLGYDRILESRLGDVIGVMGSGPRKILFDSHVDVVEVNDSDEWEFPPFGGQIENGIIHGRGTVDMKGAIAATVYAAYIARGLGLTDGKTIYVSTSTMEEDFDACALGKLLDELKLKPDFAIICEPSSNRIALGHRGRTMIEVNTNGVSCHGSAPENGKNAIYEMSKVITRIERLNKELNVANRGSVALTKIECTTPSLNAVPGKCRIYLDRRLSLGERYRNIEEEMSKILEGIDGNWNIQMARGISHTNHEVSMHTFLEAWEVKKEDPITQLLAKSYREQMDREPEFLKWDFSTNAYAPIERGIATIGMGPGDSNYAHKKNEQCPLSDITNACKIYIGCMKNV